jgi:hypothetical protein
MNKILFAALVALVVIAATSVLVNATDTVVPYYGGDSTIIYQEMPFYYTPGQRDNRGNVYPHAHPYIEPHSGGYYFYGPAPAPVPPPGYAWRRGLFGRPRLRPVW